MHVTESDTTAARDHFLSGLRILEHILVEDPGNVALRRLEAEAHMNLGDIEASENKNGDAMASYQRAIGILELLAQDHPKDPSVYQKLAEVENSRAAVFNADDDRIAAQRSVDRAVALLTKARDALGPGVDIGFQIALGTAYATRGDVAAARGDWETARRDYTNALTPLVFWLEDGRTYPAFALMAVDVHGGLQWLAEKQGDAFAAGQHRSDMKIMVRRAMAEAPQVALTRMKQLDHERAGVLVHSRAAIGEEFGRQLREAGNAEAARVCEEYVAKWKNLPENAKDVADADAERS